MNAQARRQAESRDQAIALTPDREIVIKRTLDAPPRSMWVRSRSQSLISAGAWYSASTRIRGSQNSNFSKTLSYGKPSSAKSCISAYSAKRE